MANNEHINKVVKSTGETLIDLTSDTVTAGTLLKDVTAHDRSGAQIEGTVIVAPTDVTETEDNTAYLYKNSEHDAVYDELVGGSVAWNQLVANSGSSLSVTITSGHKYIMKKSGTLSVGASSGSAITGLTGGTDWITDLTLMFGTTIADYVYSLEQSTAGSGIAWLKSYGFFTKDYYAYNAGGLVSTNVSGKKVVGKNLFEITANSETIRGVTFIVDKEAGTVTVNGTSTGQINFLLCNFKLTDILNDNVAYTLTGCPAGGDYANTYSLYVARIAGGTVWRDIGNGETYTVTSGEVLSQLYLLIRSGATVNNLVFKPMIRRADVTDPTFEPYTSITYPIQSTDLRGLYKLNGNKLYTDGDIYSADGTVTRKYGIVDLGSLEWNKDVASNVFYTSSTELPKKTGKTNILCQKYTIVDKSYTTLSNKEITGESQTQRINIKDDDYSTSGAFKIAMSGVYLIYELATPTTETAQPFTSPQMVYRNGTEEYLDTRDAPIPVGGNRKYVDIPDWMVNQYFDDLRAEISTIAMLVMEVQRLNAEIERLRGDSNAN